MKKILAVLCSAVICSQFLVGQITYVQTTNDEFFQGHQNNVIIANNDVSLPNKATSINPWLGTTNLPQILSGHKIVTWKNSAYLIGGFNGSSYSSSVYKATINTTGIGVWSTLNSLPVALRDPAVVIGNGCIYVIGGRTNNLPFNKIYYAILNNDGTIGTWQQSPVLLPEPLWGHTALYANGFIYIAGGTNLATENSAMQNVYCLRYAKKRA